MSAPAPRRPPARAPGSLPRLAALAFAALAACGGDDAREASPAAAHGPAPAAATGPGSAASPAGPWFVEARDALDFVHDAGVTPEKHLPETMGAGVALVDVDEDGDLDVYLVQGGPLPVDGAEPGTYATPPGLRPTNLLYRNDGALRFTNITAQSGAAADAHYGMGVAAGDADGDGHVDLYLANLGPDLLLRGDGKGRFEDVTARAGIRDERWSTGAAFLDADADGDLDLFVTSYLAVELASPEWCGERKEGWRSYCHPDRYPGLEDRFWRNRGDGTFADETAQAGFGDPNGKGLCALASDLDGDGLVDLFVANDSTENRLYRNLGGGRFEDATLLSGTGVDRYGRTEASMGVASGDPDLDLDLDLFVTGFDDESDTLYVDEGGLVFEDRTVQAGLELATRLPVGFGTVLADLDDDGDEDLAVVNGHIIDNIALYHDAKTHAQPALLFENAGAGRFADASSRAGDLCATPRVGRSLVAGDLDGDFDVDLVATECGGRARVFENRRGAREAVVVAGLPSHARVLARTRSGRTLLREAGPQPSYLGQGSPDVHVGLAGGDALVALRVRPVGGAEQELVFDPPVARGRLVLARAEDGALRLVLR